MISITSAEYQRLVSAAAERDTLAAQRAAEARAAEEARLREVAAREGAEAALNQQREAWQRDLEAERQRAREIEMRWHSAERDREVAGALAGVAFVSPEAAAQVRTLLESRFTTRTDASGRVIVQDASGRPAADVIREALASPAFAHFLKPTATPGSGPHRPAISAPVEEPANLGERMVAHVLANRNPASGAIGLSRIN